MAGPNLTQNFAPATHNLTFVKLLGSGTVSGLHVLVWLCRCDCGLQLTCCLPARESDSDPDD
jgi:hypothetical protein